MITLDGFLKTLEVCRDLTEKEFREVGGYAPVTPGLDGERTRQREWSLFRSNPHIWFRNTDRTRALLVWNLILPRIMEDARR